ncbi:MAG: tetratricopeptide repeat protein [Deltaproteobacteria bacterium]|nr:MAG: tetratricopeptide repeat protein [Deltaproteobacteria bacterium]
MAEKVEIVAYRIEVERYLTAIVQEAGHLPHVVKNTRDAVDLLMAMHPALVVVALDSPRIKFQELFRRIRSVSNVPVVVLSNAGLESEPDHEAVPPVLLPFLPSAAQLHNVMANFLAEGAEKTPFEAPTVETHLPRETLAGQADIEEEGTQSVEAIEPSPAGSSQAEASVTAAAQPIESDRSQTPPSDLPEQRSESDAFEEEPEPSETPPSEIRIPSDLSPAARNALEEEEPLEDPTEAFEEEPDEESDEGKERSYLEPERRYEVESLDGIRHGAWKAKYTEKAQETLELNRKAEQLIPKRFYETPDGRKEAAPAPPSGGGTAGEREIPPVPPRRPFRSMPANLNPQKERVRTPLAQPRGSEPERPASIHPISEPAPPSIQRPVPLWEPLSRAYSTLQSTGYLSVVVLAVILLGAIALALYAIKVSSVDFLHQMGNLEDSLHRSTTEVEGELFPKGEKVPAPPPEASPLPIPEVTESEGATTIPPLAGVSRRDFGHESPQAPDFDTVQQARRIVAEDFFRKGVQRSDNSEAEVAFYKKALELDPRMGSAWYNLGIIHTNRRNYGEAIAAYRQAIRVQPDLLDAYYALGVVSRTVGDLPQALEAFQHIALFAPNHPRVHLELAKIYIQQKKHTEALAALHKQLEISRDPKEIAICRQLIERLEKIER